MSNCVGRQALGHGRIPGGLLLAEGVAEDEQLAHAGDEGHLGRLAGGDEALVVAPQAGIEARGGQGGHVQDSADRGAPAPAAAAPAPGAAVAIEGRHPDQRGDLLAGAGAEFGHFGQQGRGGHGADAGDAPQAGGAGLQLGIGLQGGRHLPVQLAELGPQQGQVGVPARPAGGGRLAAPVLGGHPQLHQLAALPHQGPQVLDGLRGLGPNRRSHVGREAGQHAGTRRSVLARVPWARAKSRVWRGLTTTTGSPGRAATTARSYPPVASSTMRLGCRAWTRACKRRRPGWERGTRQVSPVGYTATSKSALATSIPRYTSAGAAIGYPPQALAARPTLRIRARHDGPGNCSGSGSAPGPGRPCSPTVSHDPESDGLSRPYGCLGRSKTLGTYKGLPGNRPSDYAKASCVKML